jgi:hypothetical protein
MSHRSEESCFESRFGENEQGTCSYGTRCLITPMTSFRDNDRVGPNEGIHLLHVVSAGTALWCPARQEKCFVGLYDGAYLAQSSRFVQSPECQLRNRVTFCM